MRAAMKLPALCLVLGLLGMTASWRALQASNEQTIPGIQTTYYSNGQAQAEIRYTDGRRDGLCRRWYADGTPMAEGSFVRGKMEGRWSWWRADGSPDPVRSGVYHSDVRTGD